MKKECLWKISILSTIQPCCSWKIFQLFRAVFFVFRKKGWTSQPFWDTHYQFTICLVWMEESFLTDISVSVFSFRYILHWIFGTLQVWAFFRRSLALRQYYCQVVKVFFLLWFHFLCVCAVLNAYLLFLIVFCFKVDFINICYRNSIIKKVAVNAILSIFFLFPLKHYLKCSKDYIQIEE